MDSVRLVLPAELDPSGVHALQAAIDRASLDACSARVLVLAGRPGEFCRGLSHDAARQAGCDVARAMAAFAACLLAIRFCAKPTIAFVDGVALGGGVGLAAACDVLIATERASFGFPEALFGLAPAAVLPVLMERLPRQRARLMALDPQTRPALDPLLQGFADEIVPSESGDLAIGRRVRALAKSAPLAVRTIKQQSAEADLSAAIERGAAISAAAIPDPRVQSALQAFASGEAPWQSR